MSEDRGYTPIVSMICGPICRVANDLAVAILPGRCPGCGVRAEPVCDACAVGLVAAPAAQPPPGVEAWSAALAYEGVTRELVARLKYRNARGALRWLAGAASDAVIPLCGAGGTRRADLVTWAPTTAARRRERGFDHAEMLARAIGSRLDLPVRRILTRLDATPQTGRAASERRSGPRFAARESSRARCVLIVDDVATTGATLSAAARSLHRAGVGSVVAATVARTPRPHSAR